MGCFSFDLFFKIVLAVSVWSITYNWTLRCPRFMRAKPLATGVTNTTKSTAQRADTIRVQLKLQQKLRSELLAEVDELTEKLQRLEADVERQRRHQLATTSLLEKPLERNVLSWEMVTERAYYVTETTQVTITPHAFMMPFAERAAELKPLISDAKALGPHLVGNESCHFDHGMVQFDPLAGLKAQFQFRKVSSDGSESFLLSAHRRFSVPIPVGDIAQPVKRKHITVHMVVPLAGRLDKLGFFLDVFLKVQRTDGNVFLTIVYFGVEGLDDARALTKAKLLELNRKAPVFRFLRKNGLFSRGGGLQHGAKSTERWPSSLKQEDMLLFFIDVDIMFDSGALLRCRMLSERGKRVYYPMVFSQYNPDIAYRDAEEVPPLSGRVDHNYTSGFWRSFGFGMACIRYSDFIASGGFDLRIEGWGAEDVKLYKSFLKHHKVAVVRAIDRGLFHAFHEKACDKKLNKDQREMCQSSKGVSEASPEAMGYVLYK